MPTIAENLKKYRKQKKLTQTALAMLSHVSRPEISAIEREQNKPKRETVTALAYAMNIPSNFIDEDLNNIKGELVRDNLDPCPEICKELDKLEKDMLVKYARLPRELRKEFYKRWDTELDNAQKKSDPRPFEDCQARNAG